MGSLVKDESLLFDHIPSLPNMVSRTSTSVVKVFLDEALFLDESVGFCTASRKEDFGHLQTQRVISFGFLSIRWAKCSGFSLFEAELRKPPVSKKANRTVDGAPDM